MRETAKSSPCASFEHPHRTMMPAILSCLRCTGGGTRISRSIKFHYFIAMDFPSVPREGEIRNFMSLENTVEREFLFLRLLRTSPMVRAGRDRGISDVPASDFHYRIALIKGLITPFPLVFFLFSHFFHFHIFTREEIDDGTINDKPFFYQKCRIFFHIAALMHSVLHPFRHINFYIFRSILKRSSRFILSDTIGRKLAISRRFAALFGLS